MIFFLFLCFALFYFFLYFLLRFCLADFVIQLFLSRNLPNMDGHKFQL